MGLAILILEKISDLNEDAWFDVPTAEQHLVGLRALLVKTKSDSTRRMLATQINNLMVKIHKMKTGG